MSVVFRVGVLEISAVALVLFVVLLPARTPDVLPPSPPLEPDTAEAIGRYQAQLAANPADGTAAEALAELLVAAGYHDWSLRLAGEATRHGASPDRWRAMLAVSATHADRVEIKKAFEWGERALAECGQPHAACPEHERIRLRIYVAQLGAGLESGIDPRLDPAKFREAISTTGVVRARVPAMDTTEPPPTPAPAPDGP